MGKILRVLPIVVISVLGFSLFEALLILPAHLSSRRRARDNLIIRLTDKINYVADTVLDRFVNGPFAALVFRAVKSRYISLSIGVTVFLITIGVIAGGYIKFVFFDTIEADNMIATLTMPQGTPFEQTKQIVERIEQAALQAVRGFDEKRPDEPSLMKHISVTVGAHPTAAR